MSNVYARVQVAWDGSNLTDETGNLIRANGSARFGPPGEAILSGRGLVDEMTVTLRNAAGRYSPLLTTGGLYAYISGGGYYQKPITFAVSIDGGSNYTTIFTGVVKSLQESGTSSKAAPEVTLTCRSADDRALQRKYTSTRAGMAQRFDEGWTESEIMAAFLNAIGYDSGDYTLDPGLWIIPWSWTDDESVLEEMWQLAAACGGRFYCGPDGKFIYENATHWLSHSASAETIGTNGFRALRVRYDDANLFNSVTVEVAPRQIEASDVLWEPDEDIVIPAGSTKNVVAKLRTPAYSIDATTWTAATAGGIDITDDVSLSATQYAQRLTLAFTNGNATYAAHIRGLQIIGRAVVGAPSVEETATSADAFWTGRVGRNRSLRGNPYIQSRPQGAMLAAMLCDWQDTPRLTFQLSGCPGKPTRALGQRITVSDANSLSANRDAFITGLSWRYGREGFLQDIEAVDATSYYPNAAYFVIGTNKLGAAGGSTAPIFY